MYTIRIRLNDDHKDKLKRIARRENRSMTGVIRNWIDADQSRPPQADELFSNKYIVEERDNV